MFEMPGEDNERYANNPLCCLEYCNLETCTAIDSTPPCGSDGTWHVWIKIEGSHKNILFFSTAQNILKCQFKVGRKVYLFGPK